MKRGNISIASSPVIRWFFKPSAILTVVMAFAVTQPLLGKEKSKPVSRAVEELVNKGERAFQSGNFDHALKIFRGLERRRDAFYALDRAYYFLGRLYEHYNKKEGASRYYRLLIDHFSESEYLCRAYSQYCTIVKATKEEEYVPCLQELVRSCSACADETIQAYQKLAAYFFERKDYPLCLTTVERLLVYNDTLRLEKKEATIPSLAALYFYKAESGYYLQKYAEAINDYKQALSLTQEVPLSDSICSGLARCYTRFSRWDEAAAWFGKVKNIPEQRFLQAQLLFLKKDYQQALGAFQSVAAAYKETPQYCPAALGEADTLYELKRFKDAERSYLNAVSACGQSPEFVDTALYGLGWCYIQQGRFKDAADFFRKNQWAFSQSAAAQISLQLSLAQLYKEEGKTERALAAFKELNERVPGSAYAGYVLFQTGTSYLDLSRVKDALLVFAELDKRFPASPYAQQYKFYLGSFYYEKGEPDSAREYLAAFLSSATDTPLIKKASLLLLDVLSKEARYVEKKEMIAQIKEGTLMQGDSLFKSQVLYRESLLLKDTGKIDEAFRLWKELAEMPISVQIRSSLYVAMGDYYYEQKDNLPQALFYYTKLINEYPYSSLRSEAFFRIAQCLIRQGKTEEAQSYLTMIISEQSDPGSKKSAYYILAELSEQHGEYTQAEQGYDQLARLFPEEKGEAFFKKGLLLFSRDEYARAKEALLFAQAQGVDSASLQFHLAACFEKLNDDEEAAQRYQRIISSFKDKDFEVKSYVRLGRLYEKSGKKQEAIAVYRTVASLPVDEAEFARERLRQLTDDESR